MSRIERFTAVMAINEILSRHGMLQKDFAAVLRVEPSTVSRWMSGHVKPPRHIELIVRLLYDDPSLVETASRLPEELFTAEP